MNENFLALPQEKQQRIINAALAVFAQNDYKRASTDDIAARAGISKGLLFYYFHNKQALYLYLFDYTGAVMRGQITDEQFCNITDFFELLTYAADKKAVIIAQNPYLMDFALRAFYSDNAAMQQKMQTDSGAEHIMTRYFGNIDFSKFKNGTDPAQILRMLTWMTDGYLNEKRRAGAPITVEQIMTDFRTWAAMFRRMAYKEEFLQ